MLRPSVETEIRNQVDEVLRVELENLRALIEKRVRRKKKKKGTSSPSRFGSRPATTPKSPGKKPVKKVRTITGHQRAARTKTGLSCATLAVFGFRKPVQIWTKRSSPVGPVG